ncbi:MAG: hypothetical protein ACTTJC_04335 [Campylobacter sp.]
MKNLIALFLAFLLFGCSNSNPEPNATQIEVDSVSKSQYQKIIKIPVNCDRCMNEFKTLINDVEYRSDVAIKCCLRDNFIDTNVALKKVFIHRITDTRKTSDAINFTKSSGRSYIFTSNPRLEALFYLFLKQELNSRGILVVETQTSPYTLRLDFSFTDLKGSYSQKSRYLQAHLDGTVKFSNINLSRQFSFTTTQEANRLKASKSKDFDLYISLLVKQMANKVAEEISKI